MAKAKKININAWKRDALLELRVISGGHGTHRHLTALADDEDFEDEEKIAMKPKSIEDGSAHATSSPTHNGIKDSKGDKKDKAKMEASSSQGPEKSLCFLLLYSNGPYTN